MHETAGANASAKRSPWLFFALVIMLAIPFWVLGFLTRQGFLKDLGINLPISALIFLCPAIAAFILVYREERLSGVARLLRRVFDGGSVRPRVWYVPALLLLPALYLLSYALMRLAGVPIPDLRISPLTILVLFALFFFTAACEEIGWTGYALDPLQQRRTAVAAALILGIIWSGVHVIPDIQGGQTLGWIVGQRLFSVALRVVMVWLYNNAGKSLFAVILMHTMDNVSVFAIFPGNGGSHYIPAVTAALTALAALIVTSLWGPKTLAHFRFAR